jgi:hypothetical protein
LRCLRLGSLNIFGVSLNLVFSMAILITLS